MIDELRSHFRDQYDIERELGGGGMSHVFLASDKKLGRRIVIKLVRSELSGPLRVERFRREIRVAAGLRHPHIVPLLDAGDVNGIPYYTMPFIDGESLRSRLTRAGPLDVKEACMIAAEVADALAYAHANAIVHRDIKPENILIDAGHAVVVDFGIAHAVAQSEEALTGTGLAIGTLAYMSPEQSNNKRAVDGRSDVYSLGCVLYEMVTGQPPFGAHGATENAGQSVTIRDLLPIIERALANDPDGRYDAVSFRAALLGKKSHVLSTRTLVAIIGVAVLAASVGLMFTKRQGNQLDDPALEQVTFVGDAKNPALSPDGKWVAYESNGKLLVNDLESSLTRAIDAPNCCREIRWMSNNKDIMYVQSGNFDRMVFTQIPRDGGDARTVAVSSYVSAWTLDSGGNAILAQRNALSALPGDPLELTRLPLIEGGPATTIKIRTPKSVASRLALSPSGKWLAVLVQQPQRSKDQPYRHVLFIVSRHDGGVVADTQQIATELAPLQTYLSWSSDGQFVFTAERILTGSRKFALALVRRPINGRSGTLGPPQSVLLLPEDAQDISGAEDGKSAAVARKAYDAKVAPGASSFLIRPFRSQRTSDAWPQRGTVQYLLPDISGDGRRLAYVQRTFGGYDVVVSTASDASPRRIFRIAASDSLCVTDLRWSPNDGRVAYLTSTTTSRESQLVVVDTSGLVLLRHNLQDDAGCDRGSALGRISWVGSDSAIQVVTSDGQLGDYKFYSHRTVNVKTGSDTLLLHVSTNGEMPAPADGPQVAQRGLQLRTNSSAFLSRRPMRGFIRSGKDGRNYYLQYPRSDTTGIFSTTTAGTDWLPEVRFPGKCLRLSMDERPTKALCQLQRRDLPDVWLARQVERKR